METSAAARSTVPVTSIGWVGCPEPSDPAGGEEPEDGRGRGCVTDSHRGHVPCTPNTSRLDRPCRTDFGLVADGRQVNGARHGGAMAEQATWW